jgi:hypothetical protein
MPNLFKRKPTNHDLAPALPDFIGIGAMRSGTSWLRQHLNDHPQILMADPKELHFFDRHFDENPDRYAACFTGSKTSSAKPGTIIRGEFTPAYAVLPDQMITTISSWMPQVKLLFSLRDPVDRAWSHARKDFAKYWSKGKPLEEATLDDLRPFFDSPDAKQRGDYLTCLQAWLAHFPQEQFLISTMEDIATNPAQVMRDHFTFLRVDPDFESGSDQLHRPANPRPPAPLPDGVRDYLEAQLYPQNDQLEKLLGRKMPWGGRLARPNNERNN